MKIGLYLGTEYTAREPMTARVEALLAQVRLARELGFDSVVAGQHYLSYPLQILQPIPFLGRVAAESGDMAIGTGILLLPLLHPVDVAEQIATLDTLCGGHFIFGVGLGYEQEEFNAFGIDRRTRRGRFEESLEIIKRLWTEDEVNFAGRYYTLEGVRPSHRPLQEPHPPIWIAANNHPAVRRAARDADAWFANPHAVHDTLAEQMAIYRAALDDAGKPVPGDVVVARELYVAKTREAAFREIRSPIERRYQAYLHHGQDAELPAGDRFTGSFEALARDRFIIGDPEDCIREIERYRALGFNYLIIDFHFSDLADDLAIRCIELFGREVAPHLR